MKTLVWSVLYGSETWTLRSGDLKRLESCKMWIWRRMEKINWREHVRSEEVSRKVGEKRSLKVTIWKRKARWIGHIMRSGGMLRTVIEGQRKEREGEEEEDWRCWMMCKKDMTTILKRRALDRGRWRATVQTGPAKGQTT